MYETSIHSCVPVNTSVYTFHAAMAGMDVVISLGVQSQYKVLNSINIISILVVV